MDLDDLKSEIRAASLGVDDLSSRVSAAELGQVKELEIDLNLAEQEINDLERKADQLKADLEDASDHGALDDLEEQLRTLAQASEALREVGSQLDDVPELSELDAAADAPLGQEDSGLELER